jgi:hypothetical protein
MSETRTISVVVNGRTYEMEVDVRLTLADFLRQRLGLTGKCAAPVPFSWMVSRHVPA